MRSPIRQYQIKVEPSPALYTLIDFPKWFIEWSRPAYVHDIRRWQWLYPTLFWEGYPRPASVGTPTKVTTAFATPDKSTTAFSTPSKNTTAWT